MLTLTNRLRVRVLIGNCIMKLLPLKKQRVIKRKPFVITPDTKRELNAFTRLQNELARCTKEGLSPKEILTTLKAARVEKRSVNLLCKPRGRAKGGGRSSKAKGRNAVVKVKELLLRTFELNDDDILVKATSMGGCDIHNSPRAQKLFPFAIEVKNQESLNIWKALAQSTVNCKKGLSPIVFFKRAGSEMYVALRAEDFLEAVKPK
jgi:hypothetical protein